MQMNRIQYQNSDRLARPEKFVILLNPDEIASPKPMITPM
jgi:hypothetical protein